MFGVRDHLLGVKEVVIVAVLGQAAVNVVDRHSLVGRSAECSESRQPSVVPSKEIGTIFRVLMPLGGAVVAASCRPGASSQQLVESLSGLQTRDGWLSKQLLEWRVRLKMHQAG